jgi:hypothetical protein
MTTVAKLLIAKLRQAVYPHAVHLNGVGLL